MSDERLRVGLGTFADFLVARASGRLDWLAKARRTYDSEYSPGGSYYDDWVRSLVRGRFGGEDGDRLAGAAARAKQDHRRAAFEELSAGWLSWLGSDPSRPVKVSAAVWAAGAVDVSVRPQLGLLRPDGGVDVVWLYVKKPVLSVEAAWAALRLLELRMEEIYPGGSPVVVDVRRALSFEPPRRWRNGFDALLQAEAAGLATLWDYGQAS